jgi:hypothetical protein
MIDTCDGSVRGAVARAFVNRTPRAATESIAGVSPRPTRSARSVSIVIRRTLGRLGGVCVGDGEQAATKNRAPARVFRTGNYRPT